MTFPVPAHRQAHPLANYLPWMLIAALLALRLATGLLPGDSRTAFDPVYQVVTYAGTALFIWWQRDRLSVYHIDTISLGLLVLFKPLQTLILPLLIGSQAAPLAFPQPLALVCWLIAILLALALWPGRKNLPALPRSSFRWLVVGAAAGVGWAFLAGLVLIPFTAPPAKMNIPFDLTVLLAFPYQIGYAAMAEEPLFRGMLWGQLRLAKWRMGWICLTQAALFTLVHANLSSQPNPLPLFAIVFMGALIMGLLAWKSHSIVPSSLFHAFYNASGILVMMLLIAMRT